MYLHRLRNRFVPLWPSTAKIMAEHIKERGVDKQPDARLFANARDEPLTRFGVRHILRKRLLTASSNDGSVTCSLRQRTAMWRSIWR